MERGTTQEKLADFLVATLLVAALHARPCLLAVFFNKEWRLAAWAGFIHGAIPNCELALGIVTARIERASLLRPLLCEISAILRAFNTERNRFRRLAFWVG